MSKITLGYWGIRGLAQPIRHLLAYSGLEFQEKVYTDGAVWFGQDKQSIGFDFPNLPYIIDGDFKLTESAAIAKYIIHRSGKTDLLGKNAQDRGRVENIIGVFNDAFKEIRGLLFNKDFQAVKIETLEKARPKLEYLKNFVGDRPFALGYLTLADFYLSENLYYFESLYPSQRKTYEFWWRIRENFEGLPEIQAYYTRPNAVSVPFLPGHASVNPKLHRVKLGYWFVRGVGQIPRLLLAYHGVDFDNVAYSDRDKWFNDDKKNIGFSFPNLPYLIDGDYKLTESTAIQRYIINRFGKGELLGKTAQDNARVESFLSIFTEISSAIKGLFWNKDWENAKGAVLEKYQGKLADLEKFVGGKEWALGYLTLIDFVVAEDSHYIQRIFPEQYKTWTFLHSIRERFNALPAISGYYKQENSVKGPFFPPYAAVSVEQ